jgi:hypothetical protein
MDRTRQALQDKAKEHGTFLKIVLLALFKPLFQIILVQKNEFFFYVTPRYTDFSTAILRAYGLVYIYMKKYFCISRGNTGSQISILMR